MSRNSDIAETFNSLREHRRQQRQEHGKRCEGCVRDHPKRDPSILLPGQQCRWCGWRRPRDSQGGN